MRENFDFSKEPGKVLNLKKCDYDGQPLISIITPYYNASKYIEQTAYSILNQTFPYWEWIIVNDGSTESHTDEVLSHIASLDERIKVLNKKNGGPAKARYFGVEHASADIIFTIDADDLIDVTMLECGYFTLLTNKEAVFAYTPICTFGDENYLYSPEFDTLKEKKENLISVASFIRKDKFLEIKEYTNLPKEVHEDWYMWLSFLAKMYKPVRMNFYGFWYRRMSTGRLGTINGDKKKSQIAEKYLKPLKKKIKTKVGAIQFPESCNYHFDSYPKEIDIGKKPFVSEKQKRRILFIFPWAVTGGADIFNLNLIKGLRKKGYEITVVTTDPKEYFMRQSFEEYVDEYFDLTTFLKREHWAGFLAYLLRSRNVDIVLNSNSFYGYYAIPWLKCKFPNVIFVDYLHAEDWSWRDGSYPRDSNAIDRYLDRTYTCTNFLKTTMIEKMGRNIPNIEVAYIGTDTEFFNPNLEYPSEKELIKKYKGKKIVLFPCRMVYLKRPIFIAKVMAELCKRRKDIICLAVGDGPAMRETKEVVNTYHLQDQFIFVGMKKDLRPYYKIADVTVVCSLTEGLTLTAYESLAMGTPVISSDVGGQKELIDSCCGKIIRKYQSIEKDLLNFNYDMAEIVEYANAIEEIVDNKSYHIMSKYCRDKMLNGFSLENMVETLHTSFEKMMKEGTKVNPILCENIEMAERYLILFNECYKQLYYNPDVYDFTKSEKLKARLWNFKIWRIFIRFLQKTGIMKLLKKINPSGKKVKQ